MDNLLKFPDIMTNKRETLNEKEADILPIREGVQFEGQMIDVSKKKRCLRLIDLLRDDDSFIG